MPQCIRAVWYRFAGIVVSVKKVSVSRETVVIVHELLDFREEMRGTAMTGITSFSIF
jgi:hypothetical protein